MSRRSAIRRAGSALGVLALLSALLGAPTVPFVGAASPTTTAIIAHATRILPDAPAAFAADVAPRPPEPYAIDWYVDDVLVATVPSDQNAVSHADLQFTAGSHSVRASFGGGGGFAASDSAVVPIATTDIRAETTTAFLFVGDPYPQPPIWAGELMPSTVIVSPDPGEGQTVEWAVDGTVVASDTTTAGGTATGFVRIPAGSHGLTATFTGGNGFGRSTTAPQTVVADHGPRTPTTTTVDVQVGTVALGDDYQVAVTVSPAGALPGTVRLVRDGGGGSIDPTVDAQGTFHFAFSEWDHPELTHYRAFFDGSGDLAASISAPFALTSIDARTPVTVTMTPAHDPVIGSEADNPVNVTVSPTPDGGVVLLYLGASVATSELLGTDGTVDIGHRGGGWLRACYIGTLQFQSACTPIQVVGSITYPTTVTLAITPVFVYADESVTVDVAVDPKPERATSFTFSYSDLSIPIDPATGTGHWSGIVGDHFEGPRPEAADDHVVAFYPGTPRTMPGHSAPVDVRLKRDHVTIAVTADPEHVVVGEPVTFHVHTSVPLPWWPELAIFLEGPVGTGLGFYKIVQMDGAGDGSVTVDTTGWPSGAWLMNVDIPGTTRTTPAYVWSGFWVEAGPDATPPVVTATTLGIVPAGIVDPSGRVPVVLTWSASDDGWGLARIDIQRSVDGGAWVTQRRTDAWLHQAVLAGHRYAFRVRGVDVAGNVSAWSTTPDTTLGVAEESTMALHYSPGWTVHAATGYLGGHTKSTIARNASVSYTFTGRSFAWIGAKGPTRGSARIYVDDVLVATVNTHSAAPTYRSIVFERHWAAVGVHTVKIVAVGTAGHARVDIDAVVFGQ